MHCNQSPLSPLKSPGCPPKQGSSIAGRRKKMMPVAAEGRCPRPRAVSQTIRDAHIVTY